MRVETTRAELRHIEADALVVGHFADQLAGPAQAVDQALGGTLTRLAESGEMSGKPLEVTRILAPAGLAARQLVVVGLGARSQAGNRGLLLRAASTASKTLAARPRNQVAFALPGDDQPELVQAAVCGAMLGCTGQDLYRAEKYLHPFSSLLWCGGLASDVAQGAVLGESVNLTRRLVNEPAGHLDPESFAAAAREAAEPLGLAVEVWDERRLDDQRCGALLAVARGSARPPRLVILRYQGGSDGQPPLALVGKGVTFDSGGLSLKPSDSMKAMKGDMAGAATVLGALVAIARLKLPVNVVGLMGLVENMVSGTSYKLGDVLTARNGKTIEVLNTDAEGRLVLADTLSVALDERPAKIVDLATLTGACVVALGTDVAGLMSNDPQWAADVLRAAERCGERAWQLPMFPEYRELINSQVADLRNVGETRWGGAITAAKFLEEFVDGKPWVHLDIAGPSMLDAPKPWLDAGGTGAMVRTLVELARNADGWK